MTDFNKLFGWLAEKRLLSVSFSWKFGKGGGKKDAKIAWIGVHKEPQEKKDERRDQDGKR